MLGQNHGYVTTQGQVTADLFASESYDVLCVSRKINRAARTLEIIFALIRHRRRLDVVVIEVYSGSSFLIADVASAVCRLLKLPVIMVLHGGELPEFIGRHLPWATRVLKRADRLAAPSTFLEREIEKLGFNVSVLRNVIDIDIYSFKVRSDIRPRLIWMRSFHEIYNPKMAVKVVAALRERFPDATLTMAGVDKGLEPAMKSMVADLDLTEAVSFPGFLNADQKARLFAEADIFINTNRIDNMPVAVVEACAFGLPVVATEVGGLPHLISHGENGLLVPDNDVPAMVQAIESLLANAALTRNISIGARKLAERSAWINVQPYWEKLFDEVLSDKCQTAATSERSLCLEKSKHPTKVA